jgi:hydrogenase maturation protease
MHNGAPRILVIGYGNPGRLDDGLGPALAEAMERLGMSGVTVESNYQLTVEDAATVAAHDIVIFADAAVSGREPFAFTPILDGAAVDVKMRGVKPRGSFYGSASTRFTSHHLEPADVLELARRLFHGEPQGYLLAIRGYDFNEFGERLSERARQNLDQAVRFLEAAIGLKLADASYATPHVRATTASRTSDETASSHGELKCKTANM